LMAKNCFNALKNILKLIEDGSQTNLDSLYISDQQQFQ
jgi:hypothetical protein